MKERIDVTTPAISVVLDVLLKDYTTGRNLVFATDSYSGIDPFMEITKTMLLDGFLVLQSRVQKCPEDQAFRTRQRAEVFTPAWICKKMNDQWDMFWFGHTSVFYRDHGKTWVPVTDPVVFPKGVEWTEYVTASCLEITCGEAPYLASRYDAATGEMFPIPMRIGLLDRKLRIATERTTDRGDWLYWVYQALGSVYGYEFQGDNLLIARINLLETFREYFLATWGFEPSEDKLLRAADIISRNVWQMDGLRGTVPYVGSSCHLPQRTFDFCVGNPPYQEVQEDTSDKPVYHRFMDISYCISRKTVLLTPARFLFGAGKTPKFWNRRMLQDEHLQVLCYEPDSAKVFPGVMVKGGLVITDRDVQKHLDPVRVFTPFPKLTQIVHKVLAVSTDFVSEHVFAPESYKFTTALYEDHPDLLDQRMMLHGRMVSRITRGHERDLTSNIFEKLLDIVFFAEKPLDEDAYVQVMGRLHGSRVLLWMKAKYLADHPNLNICKVFFPKSSGNGTFGERLSSGVVAGPGIGHTQTFLSIGCFDTYMEAEACRRYLETKFARCLLGVRKVTQDNKRSVWEYVPFLDFTISSNICWVGTISELDEQLYRMYSLSDEEIDFIEAYVR